MESHHQVAGPPEIGASAPDFEWTARDGSRESLSALRGKSVLLTFFPDGWDPAHRECLAQYEAVRRLVPGGAELVTAGTSDAWFDIDGSDNGRLLLPLHDCPPAASARSARLYGVEHMQAVFLIDADGVVRWRYVSHPGTQPSLASLLEAVETPGLRGGVTRREFLMTAVALTIAATTSPRLAHAASAQPVASARTLPASGGATVLNVNGTEFTIAGDTRVTLLDALREYIGLTGTKKGCDHGQCGACTVLLDGRRVNACLVLAKQAQGGRVVTVEGLGQPGRLHPMQAAFIEFDGFQCGYCTSGQLMSAVACVREGHARDREQIREWMSGNICRCGAYPGICTAIERARDATASRA